MQSKVLAIALALFSGLSPVAGANIERSPTPGLIECTTCSLVQRSDGTIHVIDNAIHETIARATIYEEGIQLVAKRDASVLIGPEDSVFTKRDVCTGKPCNNHGDCDSLGYCENGCNTNGRCHPAHSGWCPRSCQIHKREGGVLEIRDVETGAVIGHAE